EYVQIADMPANFPNAIMNHINNYTVGLTVPEETKDFADVRLCGTGTLVEIKGHYGILTAYHVIEWIFALTEALIKKGFKKPNDTKEIGLVLDKNLGRAKFDLQYLDV